MKAKKRSRASVGGGGGGVERANEPLDLVALADAYREYVEDQVADTEKGQDTDGGPSCVNRVDTFLVFSDATMHRDDGPHFVSEDDPTCDEYPHLFLRQEQYVGLVNAPAQVLLYRWEASRHRSFERRGYSITPVVHAIEIDQSDPALVKLLLKADLVYSVEYYWGQYRCPARKLLPRKNGEKKEKPVHCTNDTAIKCMCGIRIACSRCSSLGHRIDDRCDYHKKEMNNRFI